jgi:hypothetical protein
MPIDVEKRVRPPEEQIRYAKILSKMMKVGLAVLILTFFLYISGIIPAHIPKEKLTTLWHLSVTEYLDAIEVEKGWSWVLFIKNGDFLNFIGIVFLSGITIICFLSIIPIFFKKKDYIYALISFLEVAILILAASGLLKTGGH